MVTVEIIDTGQLLDILDAEVTYIKQVADIGDITTANSSYTWAFELPKSPENTKILEYLGIVGDQSTVPYRRVYCRLLDNGFPIVTRGLLVIQESTEDTYRAHVQDGIVEFFKDISNDTIGEKIDLSPLTHQNTVNTIIDSQSSNTFRYLIAGYNGPPLPNTDDGYTNLSPNALIPSVNVKWLWDRIFEYYGWTYEGNFDISNLWMSYPNALDYDSGENGPVARGIYSSWIQEGSTGTSRNYFRITWLPSSFHDDTYIDLNDSNRYEWQVQNTGNYQITYQGLLGYIQMENDEGRINATGFNTQIYIQSPQGNRIVGVSSSNNSEPVSEEVTLQAGDIVSLRLNVTGSTYSYRHFTLKLTSTPQMTIEALGVQTVSFYDALIKYKVKDFFKEIMIREGLTAFPNTEEKHILFKTLDERLTATAIDWTEKYAGRTSEKYIYNNYAQNNYLRHKYDEEEDSYYDGNLQVDNENLEVEKTLYQSQSFAPQEGGVTYQVVGVGGSTTFPIFKMFETEIEETEEGLIANYKPLKNRFYFMRSTMGIGGIYILNQFVGNWNAATINGTTFQDVVLEKYSRIENVLSDSRTHSIRLILSKYDVATLDLTQRYYFSQQGNYYLLNKLSWKSGGICTGEFIRVKNLFE